VSRSYCVPAALGLITTVGLVSALVGDGVLDTVSWALLGIPLLAMAWAICRKFRWARAQIPNGNPERQTEKRRWRSSWLTRRAQADIAGREHLKIQQSPLNTSVFTFYLV